MKTAFKSLPVLMICALFAFASCAGDTYDNALLNISINGNSARAAALAVSVEELTHGIVLTGPTGVLTYKITGGGNLSASVAAGTWRIDVTGFYGEEIYSTGTASVAVKAGQSSSVSVLMTVVWQEGGFIPPGTELPQLPGTTYIDGYNWWPGPNSIYAYYSEPGWDTPPYTIIGPTDGFIVQWYLGGQLVQTDTDVVFPSPSSSPAGFPSEFEVKEEYWNRDVFIIVSHPDYYGVKSNSLRICREIADDFDWDDFRKQSMGWEWEGNSFILTDSSSYSASEPAYGDGGSNADPPIPFNGYLDGNGRTFFDSPAIITWGSQYNGLFAHIGPRGTVMNLKISNGAATSTYSGTGNTYIGRLAGLNEGTIMNIAYDESYNLGSLLGNDTSTPYHSGSSYAGGIAGYNKGIIKNCYVNIEIPIFAGVSDFDYAGGIAGVNEGEISFCWVKSSVDGTQAYSGAGGIVGKNEKTINNCVVLAGRIFQNAGTNGAGRIWANGKGTGRANWANSDDSASGLELYHLSPSAVQFFVDYTDDRTDSKHGKGVQYDTSGPVYASDDAALQAWWMYTAGWDVVWYNDTSIVYPERHWHWSSTSPTSPPFYPELLF